MKFELTENKPSVTVKRTLKILTDTLTELLAHEPFEKISVTKICEKSMIPRATFYNYFDDKYDFLNYYWAQHFMEFLPHNYDSDVPVAQHLTETLENLALYLQQNFDTSKDIYQSNRNGQFFLSLLNYVSKRTLHVLEDALDSEQNSSVPLELIANILASSTLTVGYWWLTHQDEASLKDITSYFHVLSERTLADLR